MFITNKDIISNQNRLEKNLIVKFTELKKESESRDSKNIKCLEEIQESIQVLSSDISEINNDAISTALDSLSEKVSLAFKNTESEKIKKLENTVKKLESDKTVLEGSNTKIQESYENMKQQLEVANKARQTAMAKSGATSKALQNANRKIAELETVNKQLVADKQELEETINSQNELIKNITDENTKLKNKKPAPTHDQLVEDKLFHGKRRKFRK